MDIKNHFKYILYLFKGFSLQILLIISFLKNLELFYHKVISNSFNEAFFIFYWFFETLKVAINNQCKISMWKLFEKFYKIFSHISNLYLWF